MGQIERNINSVNFWKEFYLRNNIKIKNKKIKLIKGDKLMDDIFNTSNNQDLIMIEYDIYKDESLISYIRKFFIKKSFYYGIEKINTIKDIFRLDEYVIKHAQSLEKTLLGVYATKKEAVKFSKKEGENLIMIKKKYRNNSEIKCYEEEFFDLYTYKFLDEE